MRRLQVSAADVEADDGTERAGAGTRGQGDRGTVGRADRSDDGRLERRLFHSVPAYSTLSPCHRVISRAEETRAAVAGSRAALPQMEVNFRAAASAPGPTRAAAAPRAGPRAGRGRGAARSGSEYSRS